MKDDDEREAGKLDKEQKDDERQSCRIKRVR